VIDVTIQVCMYSYLKYLLSYSIALAIEQFWCSVQKVVMAFLTCIVSFEALFLKIYSHQGSLTKKTRHDLVLKMSKFDIVEIQSSDTCTTIIVFIQCYMAGENFELRYVQFLEI
jgi:hypothetical protein